MLRRLTSWLCARHLGQDKAKSFADRCVAAAEARNQRGVLEASAAEEKLLEAAAALQVSVDTSATVLYTQSSDVLV